jgi:superfamily II DNA or RNA helicase
MMYSKLKNSYIGNKGYTIYKNEITKEELDHLKKELIAKPFTNGMVKSTQDTFPIYREAEKKIYIPRYYGEKTYGSIPMKIGEGEDITLSFDGELRDYQQKVVDAYKTNIVRQNDYGGGLIEIGCGRGKTVCALKLIAEMKKKTLVIVHKEFLMNQWIERIQQFLPSCRIGKIQGQTIDIENKDVVIGMLQSLSMKDYHPTLFDTFGFTIIDEVHHISSEVFSNVLFKLITKYMLGLSATMNRKDGTTKIFKMFLGEVIYKENNVQEHHVLVKSIEYIATDEEFNKVEYDYKGNCKFSTMISKLCSFTPRSNFILKVLKDLIEHNVQQQIMILAHNKNLLNYLHDQIKEKNIGSVGYYIGGMKEMALKETETKQVIIATYSMAAEALDIKTLTTLIMATPKTDIEQAVGRILRTKHIQPVVVDIVDNHDIFQNQWRKRKTFYIKNNYKIIKTNSNQYNNQYDTWKVSFDKKEVGSSIKEKDLVGKCFIKIK